MLNERHRCRVAPNASYFVNRVPNRSNFIPLDDVGIVPGNRFILLPLKKVRTVFRRHRCCRSPATISTETSVVRKSRAVSQRALLHTAPPTHTGAVSIGGNVVPVNDGLHDMLLSGSLRSSYRSSRRAESLKQIRYSHASMVTSCLPPVLEHEQGDTNSNFIDQFSPDQRVRNREKKRQQLREREKFKRLSVHNANDTDLVGVGQSNFKRIENQNLVCELAGTLPPSMSRLHDSSLWSEEGGHKQRENSIGQDENGIRLDAHNHVGNTRSYDISLEAPGFCAQLEAGSTHRICDDHAELHPSLQEAQHVQCPSLQRHRGIPRAAPTIDYLSMALIEADGNGNRSKRLSQQSRSTSSGLILAPVPACLSEQLEQLKERELDRRFLKLGATQTVLRNRIRHSPRDSRRDSYLPVFFQFVTKKQSIKNCAYELQNEVIAKAQLRAERDFAICSNQEGRGRAAALEQENVLRGDQQVIVKRLQRRANQKLHKAYLKIHALRRNRVSPSSWSVGHTTSQVKSIDEQSLLPPQSSPEKSLKGVGELGKCKPRRSGRFGNRLSIEDFRGEYRSFETTTCSSAQRREYIKGFLCSFGNDDGDLPIGPLEDYYKLK